MSGNETIEGARRWLAGVADLIEQKNAAYGNSALPPMRVFSRADRREGLRVRIDDKLSRMARGDGCATEDTLRDLVGYLALLAVTAEPEPKANAQGDGETEECPWCHGGTAGHAWNARGQVFYGRRCLRCGGLGTVPKRKPRPEGGAVREVCQAAEKAAAKGDWQEEAMAALREALEAEADGARGARGCSDE